MNEAPSVRDILHRLAVRPREKLNLRLNSYIKGDTVLHATVNGIENEHIDLVRDGDFKFLYLIHPEGSKTVQLYTVQTKEPLSSDDSNGKTHYVVVNGDRHRLSGKTLVMLTIIYAVYTGCSKIDLEDQTGCAHRNAGETLDHCSRKKAMKYHCKFSKTGTLPQLDKFSYYKQFGFNDTKPESLNCDSIDSKFRHSYDMSLRLVRLDALKRLFAPYLSMKMINFLLLSKERVHQLLKKFRRTIGISINTHVASFGLKETANWTAKRGETYTKARDKFVNELAKHGTNELMDKTLEELNKAIKDKKAYLCQQKIDELKGLMKSKPKKKEKTKKTKASRSSNNDHTDDDDDLSDDDDGEHVDFKNLIKNRMLQNGASIKNNTSPDESMERTKRINTKNTVKVPILKKTTSKKQKHRDDNKDNKLREQINLVLKEVDLTKYPKLNEKVEELNVRDSGTPEFKKIVTGIQNDGEYKVLKRQYEVSSRLRLEKEKSKSKVQNIQSTASETTETTDDQSDSATKTDDQSESATKNDDHSESDSEDVKNNFLQRYLDGWKEGKVSTATLNEIGNECKNINDKLAKLFIEYKENDDLDLNSFLAFVLIINKQPSRSIRKYLQISDFKRTLKYITDEIEANIDDEDGEPLFELNDISKIEPLYVNDNSGKTLFNYKPKDQIISVVGFPLYGNYSFLKNDFTEKDVDKYQLNAILRNDDSFNNCATFILKFNKSGDPFVDGKELFYGNQFFNFQNFVRSRDQRNEAVCVLAVDDYYEFFIVCKEKKQFYLSRTSAIDTKLFEYISNQLKRIIGDDYNEVIFSANRVHKKSGFGTLMDASSIIDSISKGASSIELNRPGKVGVKKTEDKYWKILRDVDEKYKEDINDQCNIVAKCAIDTLKPVHLDLISLKDGLKKMWPTTDRTAINRSSKRPKKGEKIHVSPNILKSPFTRSPFASPNVHSPVLVQRLEGKRAAKNGSLSRSPTDRSPVLPAEKQSRDTYLKQNQTPETRLKKRDKELRRQRRNKKFQRDFKTEMKISMEKKCIRRGEFRRLIKSILTEIADKDKPQTKWKKNAVEALHESAEDYLIGIFGDANVCANHRKSEEVSFRDFLLAFQLRHENNVIKAMEVDSNEKAIANLHDNDAQRKEKNKREKILSQFNDSININPSKKRKLIKKKDAVKKT